ncbi:MAG: adenylyl cyclase [Chloroflexi bacterium]|nr:MAG: adenylyl cyclase [Chloroflexota bacterium]
MVGIVLAGGVSTASFSPVALAATNPRTASGQPDFGPNVYVFTPSTPQSEIQATVNAVAIQQVSNQFGQQRYALLFEPGTYGSATNPLNFQVGYYTAVAGLGLSPNDVVINGSIDVYNQCFGPGNCIALDNFWRSMSNLTINVTTPNFGCKTGEFWAVSQAAPMRRVHVNGFTTLMDYCSGPSFASGGFIADTEFDGSTVVNGSQQQWITRNSNLDGWTNGVWNQVFSGVLGAPAQCFPGTKSCGPYTTLPSSPVTREAPYLYRDAAGNDNVFVPAVQHNSVGTSWAGGPTPGSSIPIQKFFIARPTDAATTINAALGSGKDLILTPGVYHLDQSLEVSRPDTVVLGLGFPTLVPNNGIVAMQVANAKGELLSGMLFDAGVANSPILLQVGSGHSRSDNDAADPSALHDVFFRIGGATPGRATTSLVVNSSNVILDDIWAWRADHGTGVGWTSNTADTGVLVNGDNVTAYGLFVEHYQKYEVIWNGNGGTDIFFQNEMPYDPPSQPAWTEAPGVDGWAAFKVAAGVTGFTGFGMGSYSFFNQHVNILAARAFEVPASLPKASLHDLLTIFLDAKNGSGGILHVVNDTGGSSTAANPDTPVTVVAYP